MCYAMYFTAYVILTVGLFSRFNNFPHFININMMCFIKIMLEYCPSFSGPTFLVNPCNVTALKINTMVCYLSLKTAEF